MKDAIDMILIMSKIIVNTHYGYRKGGFVLKYPNIDAERVRSGMTLEQFAESLGVTRKTLYNWYTKGRIPQSKLEQMSDLFGGCSINYLLGLSNDSESRKERT